jgi:hypothetical protein
MRLFSSIAALVLTLVPGAATAQSPPAPRIVKMTLTPAALPEPVLKYHLLPWVNELKPGNGAVFYQRAHSPEIVNNYLRSPDFAHLAEWLDEPLSGKLAQKLAAFAPSQAARELDHAARCSYVDWQLTERAREDGYSLLLYDIQSFRSLVPLLAARMRLEMHQGQFAKAIFTLQTGLATGRDIGRTPILISCLVGAAACTTMLNQAETLVQLPQAPCLYWAFTDLPELVELRYPLQGERMFLDSLFPEIRHALEDEHFAAVPVDKLRERIAKLGAFGLEGPRLGYAALAALTYPQARKYFLSQGHSAEELDALPVTQLGLMYEIALYDRWFDDFYKLQALPYAQARPLARKLYEELREARSWTMVGMELVRHILPAYDKVLAVPARLQRRVALLRTIEALRLYASRHGARLPEELDDVQEVPVPLDPLTGKGFLYRRHPDGNAILEALPPPGEEANETNSIRYEIRLSSRKD